MNVKQQEVIADSVLEALSKAHAAKLLLQGSVETLSPDRLRAVSFLVDDLYLTASSLRGEIHAQIRSQGREQVRRHESEVQR